MRVLLLHPDDSFPAPRPSQHWDSVIDLGRAPESFYDEQSGALGCPVFSLFDLAVEVEDLQSLRPLLEHGIGRVVDRFGIDWWDVVSLQVEPELQEVRLALRLAERLKGCTELTVSQRSSLAEMLGIQLGIPLRILQQSPKTAMLRSMLRRGRAVGDLGFVQLRQVVYDKYDPHYRWRRKLATPPHRSSDSEPIVLLPTAYSNVTKTALSYAGILPEHKFLLVVARESAAPSLVPANVQATTLARFATEKTDPSEIQELEGNWQRLEELLQEHPEFRLSIQMNILKKGLRWLRWGLVLRDAWRRVFESRSVSGCLSADDSNLYTRIPLLLAEQRGIPAVACHHGALDCRMAFKNLRFSKYLAKGEMERDYLERICGVDRSRIRVGAAASAVRRGFSLWSNDAPWITLFTEPYETDFWRTEVIYREVIPRLCAVARRAGKTVKIKLHPFESVSQRKRMLNRILSEEDKQLVTVSGAPLSLEILQNTWCAVTVESTTAFECATAGIPAFLCGWLRHAYSGYAAQFARFQAAKMLQFPDELLQLPEMLHDAIPGAGVAEGLVSAISPEQLSEILCNTAAQGLR
jgi:hypothetical protein